MHVATEEFLLLCILAVLNWSSGLALGLIGLHFILVLQFWSYNFGLGLGLDLIGLVLVLVLTFWSYFRHCPSVVVMANFSLLHFQFHPCMQDRVDISTRPHHC